MLINAAATADAVSRTNRELFIKTHQIINDRAFDYPLFRTPRYSITIHICMSYE